MELLLNIIWVLIAAGVFGIWRAHWVHQRPRTRRNSLHEWTAVGMALVLLFFAVSMTDDLHCQVILSEESSAGRRNVSCSAGTHPLGQSGTLPHTYFPAFIRHVSYFAPVLGVAKLEPLVARFTSDPQNERLSGRAPPVSAL